MVNGISMKIENKSSEMFSNQLMEDVPAKSTRELSGIIWGLELRFGFVEKMCFLKVSPCLI